MQRLWGAWEEGVAWACLWIWGSWHSYWGLRFPRLAVLPLRLGKTASLAPFLQQPTWGSREAPGPIGDFSSANYAPRVFWAFLGDQAF